MKIIETGKEKLIAKSFQLQKVLFLEKFLKTFIDEIYHGNQRK